MENGFVNRGYVRGGANSTARLHLHLHPDIPDEHGNIPENEARALCDVLGEKFPGLEFHRWSGLWTKINTRRQFALIPAVIRFAAKAGWDVSISMWDVGVKGQVKLSEDPETFWRELAAASLWYERAT